MSVGLNIITANLGIAIEHLVLIIVTLGAMIFFAKDFKLGVVMNLIGSALVFMLAYQLGWDFAPALIVFFMWLVILSFTLYAMARTTSKGAII